MAGIIDFLSTAHLGFTAGEYLIEKVADFGTGKFWKKLKSEFQNERESTIYELLYDAIEESVMLCVDQNAKIDDIAPTCELLYSMIVIYNVFNSEKIVLALDKLDIYTVDESKWEKCFLEVIVKVRYTPLREFMKMKNVLENNSEIVKNIFEINKSSYEIKQALIEITNSPEFIGEYDCICRDNEIEDIKNLIKNNKPIILVNGLGGIGKTTVCKRLYHMIREEYELCGWFTYNESMEKTLLEQSYLCLEEKDNRLKKILNELNNNPGRKLLCIDNVDSNCLKDKLFRSLTGNKNITMIATSRLDKIEDFQPYTIDLLNEEQCVELFKLYCEKDLDDNTIRNFVKLVSCHTLGVELLAKSIPESMSVDEFYNKLVDKGFQFPKIESETRYLEGESKTIAQHLRKLFNITEKTDEEKRILYYFSIMPSIKIPADVIKWIDCDENDIRRLHKTGWLSYSEGKYYMHPIIKQTILLDEENFPGDLGKEFIVFFVIEEYVNAMETYVEVLPKLDIASSVIDYQKLDEDKLLGTAYNNLGILYQNQGIYEEAEKYYKKALAITKKILGEENIEIATTYYNIACLYQLLENYEESEKYYKESLVIREKRLGTDDPQIAATYNNLGVLYQEQKKYKESEKYCRKALAIYERVFGTENSNTAITYNNLGLLYHHKKDYKKAEKYYKKALIIQEKILGTDNTHTTTIYFNLAGLYFDQKNYEESEKYYKKDLKVREKIFGPCHPNTVEIYGSLAVVYIYLGNYEEAGKYYKKAFEKKLKRSEKSIVDCLFIFNKGDIEK